jgi:hypothetical protein
MIYELKYPALLGIQDKVKEFEWLIMFIYHRNVSVSIVLIVAFLSCLETVLQTKNTLHQIWLKSVKGLKRKNSYVAFVFRRVLNSRYTKFGLNRLRG